RVGETLAKSGSGSGEAPVIRPVGFLQLAHTGQQEEAGRLLREAVGQLEEQLGAETETLRRARARLADHDLRHGGDPAASRPRGL
ncbi:MAG: hypothetical protein SX243_17760, partial [Acidobacteriota bacterium]|nr:hypothetical protein [Acidobacteriota bacterium]